MRGATKLVHQLLSLRWNLCSPARDATTMRRPREATRESQRAAMKTQHSKKKRVTRGKITVISAPVAEKLKIIVKIKLIYC